MFGRPTMKKDEEYQRTCDVLDRMSSNIKAVKCLAIRMRALLYPSEEVPAAQFLAAKAMQEKAAMDAALPTKKKVGESKMKPKRMHTRGGSKKGAGNTAVAKSQNKKNDFADETVSIKPAEMVEVSTSVKKELKGTVNRSQTKKVVVKSPIAKEEMTTAAVEHKETGKAAANLEMEEELALSGDETDGGPKKRSRKRRRQSQRQIEIDKPQPPIKRRLTQESEKNADLTPVVKKRKP